jgi:hypothetical protein
MPRLRNAMVVTLFALVACSSGSGSSTPTTVDDGDPRSKTEITTDRAAADSALLTVSDLPDGWSAAEDASDDDADAGGLASCLGVEASKSPASASSPRFVAEPAAVSSTVSVLATHREADRAVTAITSPDAAGCLTDALRDALGGPLATDVPDGYQLGTPAVADLPFAELGQDSRAFRVTVPVATPRIDTALYLDVVFVRAGRAVALLTLLDALAPFDSALATQLATTLATRLPVS